MGNLCSGKEEDKKQEMTVSNQVSNVCLTLYGVSTLGFSSGSVLIVDFISN